MRETVASITGNTYVLILGVGRYRTPGPTELDAAGDARAIARVLGSQAGGGIPPANIESLVDGQASYEAVDAALNRLANRATENTRLVVYYSGHGQVRENEFFFQLFDTDFDAEEPKALSARRAVASFAGCPARGLLFLIDCCDGAGFAETAPEFFSQLSAQDFRIVIAASLKYQAARQPYGSRSTFTGALIDIVEGRRACGLRPGELTYLALMEALRFVVDEKQRNLPEGSLRQRVAIAGVATGDPLLFVSARQLVRHTTLETDRVSLSRHRQLVASWVGGSALALLLLTGLFLAWASSYRYLLADSSGTTVYLGHPGVAAFGLPHRLETLPYSIDEFRMGNALADGTPYVFPEAEAPLAAAQRFVNPALLAAEALENGHRDVAHRIVGEATRRGTPGLTDFQGLMLLALQYRLATAREIGLIRRGLNSDTLEYRHSAMTALLDVDQAEALGDLTKDLARDTRRFDHQQALTELHAPCSEAALAYLRAVVGSAEYSHLHPDVALAWHQAGCSPTLGDVRSISDAAFVTELEPLGSWIQLVNPALASAIAADTETPEWRRVGLLTGVMDLPCQPSLLHSIATTHKVHAALAIRYMRSRCPNIPVSWRVDARGLSATATVDGNPIAVDLPAPIASVSGTDALAFVILAPIFAEASTVDSRPFLLAQLRAGEEGLVAPTALLALRWAHAPWQPGSAFFRSGNEQSHALLYYLWMFDTDPAAAMRVMSRRLGNPIAQYSGYFAAVATPDPQTLTDVRMLASGAGARASAAAEWLSMYGTPEDLTTLETSQVKERRDVLQQYASYNRNTLSWLNSINDLTVDPRLPLIARRAQYANGLLAELRSLPGWARCWRLGAEWERRRAPEPVSGSEYLPAGTQALVLKLLESNGCTFNYAERFH